MLIWKNLNANGHQGTKPFPHYNFAIIEDALPITLRTGMQLRLQPFRQGPE
jgi:hypothetical protein